MYCSSYRSLPGTGLLSSDLWTIGAQEIGLQKSFSTVVGIEAGIPPLERPGTVGARYFQFYTVVGIEAGIPQLPIRELGAA